EEGGVDVDDATGEAFEEGSCEEVHVAGEDDEIDATKLQPIGDLSIARGAVRKPFEREDATRDASSIGASERGCVGSVGGDRRDREAGIDQRLQVGPLARHQDSDHASAPITSAPSGASGTTAHRPMPRLNTRRNSSSSTPRSASQPKTAGRSQECQ